MVGRKLGNNRDSQISRKVCGNKVELEEVAIGTYRITRLRHRHWSGISFYPSKRLPHEENENCITKALGSVAIIPKRNFIKHFKAKEVQQVTCNNILLCSP